MADDYDEKGFLKPEARISFEEEMKRQAEYLEFQNSVEESRRKKAEWELRVLEPKPQKQPIISKDDLENLISKLSEAQLNDLTLKCTNSYFDKMVAYMQQLNHLSFEQWQQYYNMYVKVISADIKGFDYAKYGAALLSSTTLCITYDEERLFNLESTRLSDFLQTYKQAKNGELNLSSCASDIFELIDPNQPKSSRK